MKEEVIMNETIKNLVLSMLQDEIPEVKDVIES